MKQTSKKIYIAGKLETKEERKQLEEIDKLCKSLGLKTFLPHRDIGILKNIKEVDKIFKGDIKKGFKDCILIIALLDGLRVGAGTAWELGYAYAKGIPAIGLKTDEPIEKAISYLSAILIGSMTILKSLEELEENLKKFKLEKDL